MSVSISMDKWAFVLQKIGEFELITKDQFNTEGDYYSSKSISQISKDLDVTYSHTHLIVKEFLKLGWVKEEIVGRWNIPYLTKKGKEINENAIPILLELKKKLQ